MPEEILNFSDRGFALFVIGMFFAVLAVVIWQGLRTYQVRMTSLVQIARDEAYRKLAEEAVAAQNRLSEDMADLRVRVTSMEKMLREVE